MTFLSVIRVCSRCQKCVFIDCFEWVLLNKIKIKTQSKLHNLHAFYEILQIKRKLCSCIQFISPCHLCVSCKMENKLCRLCFTDDQPVFADLFSGASSHLRMRTIIVEHFKCQVSKRLILPNILFNLWEFTLKINLIMSYFHTIYRLQKMALFRLMCAPNVGLQPIISTNFTSRLSKPKNNSLFPSVKLNQIP